VLNLEAVAHLLATDLDVQLDDLSVAVAPTGAAGVGQYGFVIDLRLARKQTLEPIDDIEDGRLSRPSMLKTRLSSCRKSPWMRVISPIWSGSPGSPGSPILLRLFPRLFFIFTE